MTTDIITDINQERVSDVDRQVASIIIDDELAVSKTNQSTDDLDFESVVAMLECKRNERDYEWMSDVFIPELPSIVMTDASQWSNQYFQTRDFVEVKLEGDNPDDEGKCRAVKKTINKTLNRRGLYHYHKFMRARTINSLSKRGVWIVAGWEKDVRFPQVGVDRKPVTVGMDEYGMPMMGIQETPIIDKHIMADHFDYEVVDPRNVFTDNTYCYSPQQKRYVIIRSEKNYVDLMRDAKRLRYINLDKIKDWDNKSEPTVTSKESYNKDAKAAVADKTPIKPFDVYTRYGKFWCIVQSQDQWGHPETVVPGIDDRGEILDGAELIETIIDIAVKGSTKVVIRFQANVFRDRSGNVYRPLARGLCYIHPTKDGGLSDGMFLRELQVAENDMFNLAIDRTKLATMPTLKGRKYSLEDNSTIYFEPEHVMELESPEDVVEFKIQDNIEGALGVLGMLFNKGQQATSIYPTTMGQLPSQASTTATAVAGAESRSNLRSNYKSLTFEYTFLSDFYWLIIQMTDQFAEEETAKKLMGDDVRYWDPDMDYVYAPVSSNIELEFNKYRKVQLIDQMMGRVVNFPNAKTPALLNYMLGKVFELFGSELPQYKKYLLDESPEAQQMAMTGGQVPQLSQPQVPPNPMMSGSNQYGMPQTNMERMTRGY